MASHGIKWYYVKINEFKGVIFWWKFACWREAIAHVQVLAEPGMDYKYSSRCPVNNYGQAPLNEDRG